MVKSQGRAVHGLLSDPTRPDRARFDAIAATTAANVENRAHCKARMTGRKAWCEQKARKYTNKCHRCFVRQQGGTGVHRKYLVIHTSRPSDLDRAWHSKLQEEARSFYFIFISFGGWVKVRAGLFTGRDPTRRSGDPTRPDPRDLT